MSYSLCLCFRYIKCSTTSNCCIVCPRKRCYRCHLLIATGRYNFFQQHTLERMLYDDVSNQLQFQSELDVLKTESKHCINYKMSAQRVKYKFCNKQVCCDITKWQQQWIQSDDWLKNSNLFPSVTHTTFQCVRTWNINFILGGFICARVPVFIVTNYLTLLDLSSCIEKRQTFLKMYELQINSLSQWRVFSFRFLRRRNHFYWSYKVCKIKLYFTLKE